MAGIRFIVYDSDGEGRSSVTDILEMEFTGDHKKDRRRDMKAFGQFLDNLGGYGHSEIRVEFVKGD